MSAVAHASRSRAAFSRSAVCMWLSTSSITPGFAASEMRTRADAVSIRSTPLSGCWRPAM